MNTSDLLQAFLNGEHIASVRYAHNDYVQVVAGAHAGQSGSLVSLLSVDPEPLYVVELESGIDAEVLQSELYLANP